MGQQDLLAFLLLGNQGGVTHTQDLSETDSIRGAKAEVGSLAVEPFDDEEFNPYIGIVSA